MEWGMGYISHSIDQMGEPFVSVDEMIFVIPEGGQVAVMKDQFKVLFFLKGEAEHLVDGMEEPRKLNAGDILVCPGFSCHRYLNPDKESASKVHVLRLFLDGEAIRKRAEADGVDPELDLTEYVRRHFTKTFQCSGAIDSGINESIVGVRREAETRGMGYRHRARAHCMNLLVAVSRLQDPVKTQKPRPERSTASLLVISAKEYILKNLSTKLTLGDVAWKVGKGEEHLARVFKRETGQSVFDFVREMRIEQAKTHLYDTSLSLTDIAQATGFASLSYFSRTFREMVGMSPSQYRNHIEASLKLHPVGTDLISVAED